MEVLQEKELNIEMELEKEAEQQYANSNNFGKEIFPSIDYYNKANQENGTYDYMSEKHHMNGLIQDDIPIEK